MWEEIGGTPRGEVNFWTKVPHIVITNYSELSDIALFYNI